MKTEWIPFWWSGLGDGAWGYGGTSGGWGTGSGVEAADPLEESGEGNGFDPLVEVIRD